MSFRKISTGFLVSPSPFLFSFSFLFWLNCRIPFHFQATPNELVDKDKSLRIHNSVCTLSLHIRVYYIHTEKYSPKSYVINFRTQISPSQSEEQTMVFTREKNDTSNQNRERCFFTCETNDMSNQKPQTCVSFAPKFPPFIAACSAALHTFNEKSFTQRLFLAIKVKNISEME